MQAKAEGERHAEESDDAGLAGSDEIGAEENADVGAENQVVILVGFVLHAASLIENENTGACMTTEVAFVLKRTSSNGITNEKLSAPNSTAGTTSNTYGTM